MGTAFHHFAPIQDNDLVAIADGAETVGYDQARAAPASQVVVNHFFCFGIQDACCLVENENPRIGNKSACYFKPLSLSPPKVAASFEHQGFISSGPVRDVIVDASILGRVYKHVVGDGAVPQREVLAN